MEEVAIEEGILGNLGLG